MTAVGRGRCYGGTAGCTSRSCPYHGDRNKHLFDAPSGGPYRSEADLIGTGLHRAPYISFVPLAPTKPRRGLAAIVVGLAVTAAGVLMAAGVAYFVQLLGGGR